MPATITLEIPSIAQQLLDDEHSPLNATDKKILAPLKALKPNTQLDALRGSQLAILGYELKDSALNNHIWTDSNCQSKLKKALIKGKSYVRDRVAASYLRYLQDNVALPEPTDPLLLRLFEFHQTILNDLMSEEAKQKKFLELLNDKKSVVARIPHCFYLGFGKIQHGINTEHTSGIGKAIFEDETYLSLLSHSNALDLAAEDKSANTYSHETISDPINNIRNFFSHPENGKRVLDNFKAFKKVTLNSYIKQNPSAFEEWNKERPKPPAGFFGILSAIGNFFLNIFGFRKAKPKPTDEELQQWKQAAEHGKEIAAIKQQLAETKAQLAETETQNTALKKQLRASTDSTNDALIATAQSTLQHIDILSAEAAAQLRVNELEQEVGSLRLQFEQQRKENAILCKRNEVLSDENKALQQVHGPSSEGENFGSDDELAKLGDLDLSHIGPNIQRAAPNVRRETPPSHDQTFATAGAGDTFATADSIDLHATQLREDEQKTNGTFDTNVEQSTHGTLDSIHVDDDAQLRQTMGMTHG